ncbi:E3 ubiquitin-protein ligase UPL2-like [Salvia miltiorrhiza]|uniref:E3 ubiquitin-protein ligase UPL2-like n=1 Tax=Salvia miltiorrhiza TaxID=226208 RepID=UPI0025AC7BA7|nr:E3 ubiquitin-protein ligase UPL2-like [Salvia miltiorrhiza]
MTKRKASQTGSTSKRQRAAESGEEKAGSGVSGSVIDICKEINADESSGSEEQQSPIRVVTLPTTAEEADEEDEAAEEEDSGEEEEAVEEEESGEEEEADEEDEAAEEEDYGEEEESEEEENSKESAGEDEDDLSSTVQWQYLRKGMEKIKHKVNITGKENNIEIINNVLEGDNVYRELQESVFSDFLKLPSRVSRSGQCLHLMISRQIAGKSKPDETALFFIVDGYVTRFSRIEFFFMTGLKFGSSNFNPYADHIILENSFYQRVLGGREIYPNKLREMFMTRGLGEHKADYVKAAKMLLVTDLIFGYDGTNYRIPDWLWVLLEDTTT